MFKRFRAKNCVDGAVPDRPPTAGIIRGIGYGVPEVSVGLLRIDGLVPDTRRHKSPVRLRPATDVEHYARE